MWKELTTEDLKTILSQDELDLLETISTEEIESIVQKAIDLTSAMFRGAFSAKGYEIDIREGYVPDSYALPILQYARYVAWSRFPNSLTIAIDEVRKEQVKLSLELLKDPYVGTEKPEWEYSSRNPDATGSNIAGSITIPPLKFDETRIALGI